MRVTTRAARSLSQRVIGAAFTAVCAIATSASVLCSQSATTYDTGYVEDRHCYGGFSGLTYGAPLKLAVSGAAGIRKVSETGGDLCAYVSPKLGLGGAMLSAGLIKDVGSLGGAVGLSGGFLRTFGAPFRADRMSNYAGASLHVMPLLAFGIEIGYYRRIGGNAGVGRENIITWSVGLGF